MKSKAPQKPPSLLGGSCIVASLCVGAGMLGLPSAGAGSWTLCSLAIMALTMVVMTLSGWMILEAFKPYSKAVSLHSVVRDRLGTTANRITNGSFYFVGAVLLYAYITTAGRMLAPLLHLSTAISSFLFTLLFAGVVWHSTRAVDRLSVLLIIFMIASFVLGIAGLLMHLDISTLLNQTPTPTQEAHYARYALGMLPVALASFGYHQSLTSLRLYYGCEERVKKAILGGMFITFTFYAVWLCSVYGNLPRSHFGPILAEGGHVDLLLSALEAQIDNPMVHHFLNAFSMAAIFSSFVGVGLGMLDFSADLCGLDQSRSSRTRCAALTFLPPLALSIIAPMGFVLAIGYVGAAATIWTCIIPALLIHQIKRSHNAANGMLYQRWAIYSVFIFGLLTASLHVLNLLGLLPKFSA